jgi:hypothetical protein
MLKAARVSRGKIPLEFNELTKERLLAEIAERIRVRNGSGPNARSAPSIADQMFLGHNPMHNKTERPPDEHGDAHDERELLRIHSCSSARPSTGE